MPALYLASAAAASGVAGLAWATSWRDPHRLGAWGVCPWLMTTGTPCPTCGGLRAFADLVAGRPGAALSHHPFLVATFGVILVALVCAAVVMSARFVKDRQQGGHRSRAGMPPALAGWRWRLLTGWLMGLVVFGLARGLNPSWWPPLGIG